MKKLILMGMLAAFFMAFAGSVSALTVYDMIGDDDGYGYGVADGAALPATLFDNRSAAEIAAVNGAQATDLADNFDVTFAHTFNVAQFASITSATFYIDIHGLQQGVFGGNSHLYLDGTQVLPFEGINLGAFGSGVFAYAVNVADLADGALNVYFDNWTTFDAQGNVLSSDYIGIDYTKLAVSGVAIPEPATMILFGIGMVGMGLRRKFLK